MDSGSPGIPHLRSLDGLRGVAVLAVLVFHFSDGVLPGGFLGVDIFFVLSGFLITSLLVNEWDNTGRIRLSSFWARRAKRLLPALFLVLVTVGAYAMLSTNRVEAQHIAGDALAAFGYVANWHFIASSQSYIATFVHTAPSPVRHTWSLAIEEQFYLLWPLIVGSVALVVAAVAGRRGQSRRRFRQTLGVVCIALAVASIVRMVTLFDPGNPNRVYYGTDTRAFALLIGAALGVATAGVPAISRHAARRMVIVGGVLAATALLAAMALVDISSAWLYQGGYGAVALVMAVVLVAAAQPGRNPLRRALESRALVGLGLISYGVYLWHWPAVVWLTEESTGIGGVGLFAVRATATLGTALASYVLVEMPIRRGRFPFRKPAVRRIAQAAIAGAVAIALLVPVLTLPKVQAAPTSKLSNAVANVTSSYVRAPRCDKGAPAFKVPKVDRGITVQLVGNSIATELAPCLGKILAKSGVHLDSIARNGYPTCKLYREMVRHFSHRATRPRSPSSSRTRNRARCSIGPTSSVHHQDVAVTRGAGVPRPVRASRRPDLRRAHEQRRAHSRHRQRVPAGCRRKRRSGHRPRRGHVPPGRSRCVPMADAMSAWRRARLRADQSVFVRTWIDSGLHFCAGEYTGFGCPSDNAAGERRIAAAVAGQLLESLAHSTGKPLTRSPARRAQKPGSAKGSGAASGPTTSSSTPSSAARPS